MSEELDIYDANLRPQGRMDRVQAHRTGQWHRTFHCWLVDTAARRIVFQYRGPNTDLYAGQLDVTAAGHLAAGETVEHGVREVQEELGIEVRFEDLIFAGERTEAVDTDDGVRNREYQSVFFFPSTVELHQLRPDPAEVAGLAALPITGALDLFSGRTDAVDAETVMLAAGGALRPGRRLLVREDFAPRIPRYYLAATICAERLCDGHRDIAIS